MPRVNRDLQRRMAARRDRDRRRSGGERRYRFGPSEANSALEADDTSLRDEDASTETMASPPKRSRVTFGDTTQAAARGGARVAPRPFSAYTAEYGYVLGDLRRVALVIGSLLVILLVLFFVLPR